MSPSTRAASAIPSSPGMSLSSSRANVPTLDPSASAGSQRPCCAGEPPSFTAVKASALDTSGLGKSVRPASSSSTTKSTHERPAPPCSSGTNRPSQPSEAISVQSSGEWASRVSIRLRTSDIGHRPSTNLRTASRRKSCSSVNPKFMRGPLGWDLILGRSTGDGNCPRRPDGACRRLRARISRFRATSTREPD